MHTQEHRMLKLQSRKAGITWHVLWVVSLMFRGGLTVLTSNIMKLTELKRLRPNELNLHLNNKTVKPQNIHQRDGKQNLFMPYFWRWTTHQKKRKKKEVNYCLFTINKAGLLLSYLHVTAGKCKQKCCVYRPRFLS